MRRFSYHNFLSFLVSNKQLLFLFLISFLLGFLRDYVEYLANIFSGFNILFAILIYYLLAVLLLPTLPLNLVFGAAYGPLITALIFSVSVLFACITHSFIRPLIPIKRSPEHSIIGRLRSSPFNLQRKLFLVRLNPFLPLPITSSLLVESKKDYYSLFLYFLAIYFGSLLPTFLVSCITFYPNYIAFVLLSLGLCSLPTYLIIRKT